MKIGNNKIKIVILAAGKGVRMLPLTNDIPKVLVKINGKEFLYYVIKNLQKASYKNFCLIVGYKKEKIEEFLKRENIKAELIEQKEIKGTGDAVMQAKSFVGQDNFIVLGGDNLWSSQDLASVNKEDTYNYISAIEVNNPEKYGVLVEENNFLKEIKEKPKDFVGNLINTGLYKFTPEIFEALEKIKISPRGEYELTDAITLLAKEKKVKVLKIKDYWKDLGSLSDIEPMDEFLKNFK
ncbi:MAG: sugar phosphate nucleotidyltransferase [Candidatus Paceibacterota bacterium]|jgi:bifunctional UDP-N-acetylglucosamine pyrophosphorylase/glucosamine-1-phosphate N-acetyltransferase